MLQLFFQHARFVALFWPQGLPPGVMVCLGARPTTGLGWTGEAKADRRSANAAQQAAVGLPESQSMTSVWRNNGCALRGKYYGVDRGVLMKPSGYERVSLEVYIERFQSAVRPNHGRLLSRGTSGMRGMHHPHPPAWPGFRKPRDVSGYPTGLSRSQPGAAGRDVRQGLPSPGRHLGLVGRSFAFFS